MLKEQLKEKIRRQCIRCGKALVRKTEVLKRKVWVEESQEDSK